MCAEIVWLERVVVRNITIYASVHSLQDATSGIHSSYVKCTLEKYTSLVDYAIWKKAHVSCAEQSSRTSGVATPDMVASLNYSAEAQGGLHANATHAYN